MSLRHDIIPIPKVLGTFTLESLAETTGMPLDLLHLLVDHGLIEPVARDTIEPRFEAACVIRLRVIGRLRRDLGINLPGIAAVLDLLDRVQSLQRELDTLRFRTVSDRLQDRL